MGGQPRDKWLVGEIVTGQIDDRQAGLVGQEMKYQDWMVLLPERK